MFSFPEQYYNFPNIWIFGFDKYENYFMHILISDFFSEIFEFSEHSRKFLNVRVQ